MGLSVKKILGIITFAILLFALVQHFDPVLGIFKSIYRVDQPTDPWTLYCLYLKCDYVEH